MELSKKFYLTIKTHFIASSRRQEDAPTVQMGRMKKPSVDLVYVLGVIALAVALVAIVSAVLGY